MGQALHKLVDQEKSAMQVVRKAPKGSLAEANGERVVHAIAVRAKALLDEQKAAPKGALAAVSDKSRSQLFEALLDFKRAVDAEYQAAVDGNSAAFGDGTLLRILLEYLPMLLELFNQFFGAQPSAQPAGKKPA